MWMQVIMAPANSAKRTKWINWKSCTHYWNKQFTHTLSYIEIASVYTEQCCHGFVNVSFLSCEDITLWHRHVDSTTHTLSEKLFMVHICILHPSLHNSLAPVHEKITIQKNASCDTSQCYYTEVKLIIQWRTNSVSHTRVLPYTQCSSYPVLNVNISNKTSIPSIWEESMHTWSLGSLCVHVHGCTHTYTLVHMRVQLQST